MCSYSIHQQVTAIFVINVDPHTTTIPDRGAVYSIHHYNEKCISKLRQGTPFETVITFIQEYFETVITFIQEYFETVITFIQEYFETVITFRQEHGSVNDR
jgi:hypothetical protein